MEPYQYSQAKIQTNGNTTTNLGEMGKGRSMSALLDNNSCDVKANSFRKGFKLTLASASRYSSANRCVRRFMSPPVAPQFRTWTMVHYLSTWMAKWKRLCSLSTNYSLEMVESRIAFQLFTSMSVYTSTSIHLSATGGAWQLWERLREEQLSRQVVSLCL